MKESWEYGESLKGSRHLELRCKTSSHPYYQHCLLTSQCSHRHRKWSGMSGMMLRLWKSRMQGLRSAWLCRACSPHCFSLVWQQWKQTWRMRSAELSREQKPHSCHKQENSSSAERILERRVCYFPKLSSPSTYGTQQQVQRPDSEQITSSFSKYQYLITTKHVPSAGDISSKKSQSLHLHSFQSGRKKNINQIITCINIKLQPVIRTIKRGGS